MTAPTDAVREGCPVCNGTGRDPVNLIEVERGHWEDAPCPECARVGKLLAGRERLVADGEACRGALRTMVQLAGEFLAYYRDMMGDKKFYRRKRMRDKAEKIADKWDAARSALAGDPPPRGS